MFQMKNLIRHSIPLLIALAALLAVPAVSVADQPAGRPVITVPLGEKGKGLRAKGVKITALGGGLIYRQDSVGLLASDISVGGKDRVNIVLRGGVKLKVGKRSVKLTGLFVQLRAKELSVSAKAGKKRITLFTGKFTTPPEFDVARIAATFSTAKTTLTKGAVKYLRAKLKKFKPRNRTLGKFAGNAFVIAPPQTGAVTPPETAYSCLPVSASTDPAKPATATDLSCGYLVFHTRDSWTKYIELNYPIAPASGLPAYDGKNHVCADGGAAGVVDAYSLSLPVKSGWWDAASGKGYIATAGGVHYRYDGRGIDVTIVDLEVSINGGSSTVYATTTDSYDPTPKRIPFATFNPAAPLAGAAPGPGAPLSRLKLSLTPEAVPLFDLYDAGSGFGCLDLGFNF